ncbi:MAG: GNAT family N-acetyltransferase [Planctomycetes bacterium]|nr:GNAT family N-acetyltransferase [Planctomycetota bacterium]
MERQLKLSRVRHFAAADAGSIAQHMNDPAIWRNLRDRVPHPYSVEDARAYLAAVAAGDLTAFAIDVAGAAVGAIGGRVDVDVRRRTFEVGFWLGRAFQGRGIVSEIVPPFVEWLFAEFDVNRIEAQVFGWNTASERVLAKAGFVREGVLRAAITKAGETTDLSIWAVVRA